MKQAQTLATMFISFLFLLSSSFLSPFFFIQTVISNFYFYFYLYFHFYRGHAGRNITLRKRAAYSHFVSLMRTEESATTQEYYENIQPISHYARTKAAQVRLDLGSMILDLGTMILDLRSMILYHVSVILDFVCCILDV